MKIIEIFVAFDGEHFEDKAACLAHESANIEGRVVGLTIEQVRAAITRTDTELADALEEVGNRIAKARRESGELKRRPKGKVEDVVAPATTGPSAEEQDWQALLHAMMQRFSSATTEAELLTICDEERERWYNDAPKMIRHQAEESFEEHRLRICAPPPPMAAPMPPAPTVSEEDAGSDGDGQ